MRLPLSVPALGLAVAVLAGGSAAFAAAGPFSDDGSTQVSQISSDDDGPGDISGPCDEAENANDARCTGAGAADARPDGTSTTSSTSTTMPSAPAPAPSSPSTGSGNRALPSAGGTVTYTAQGGTLTLVSAVPNAGWSVEVEQSSGRELEVDFRSGTRRVQVNVEFEDGGIRERVRLRDDADDSEVRIENGVVVRQEHGDDRGDDHDDDHGGDRSGGDDHGGSSGSGSSGSGSSGSGSSGSGSSGSGSSGSGSSGSG
jgi:hypothetical protein